MGEEQTQKPVGVKIVPPARNEFPLAHYANYVLTSNTEYEVVLDFAQINPPLTESEVASLGENPQVEFRPVVRVAIPHVLLEPLIGALQERSRVIGEQANATGAEAEG
jgi:hypothetical protein